MSGAVDWVFFDCFNTLIDDFDTEGGEFGLGTLPDLTVSAGYFATREAFLATYHEQRKSPAGPGRETLFDDRLRRTLAAGSRTASPAEIDATLTRLLSHWEDEYRRSLRLAPGAAEMLAHWAPRAKLGVVSNFFLPHYPLRYLQEFGLAHHFQFVVDSAAFGFRKPHRALFAEALRLAGLGFSDAPRVLFIGDRLDLDVQPALELGFQAVHFNRARTRPHVAPTPPGLRHIHDLADFR